MAKAWRHSERRGDVFAGLECHSVCHEALRSFRGGQCGPVTPSSLDSSPKNYSIDFDFLLIQLHRERRTGNICMRV